MKFLITQSIDSRLVLNLRERNGEQAMEDADKKEPSAFQTYEDQQIGNNYIIGYKFMSYD